MGLVRTSTPQPILTPESVKDHLRVDGTQDDSVLTGLILVAQDHIERETRTVLTAADYQLTLSAWPRSRQIDVPRSPTISAGSISYTKPDGTDAELSSENFVAFTAGTPGRIFFPPDLPDLAMRPDVIRITFRAGYEDVAAIPATLIHAAKLLIGHWFENREAATDRRIDQIPIAVESLLANHIVPEVL